MAMISIAVNFPALRVAIGERLPRLDDAAGMAFAFWKPVSLE
jgi:hypothetical protein